MLFRNFDLPPVCVFCIDHIAYLFKACGSYLIFTVKAQYITKFSMFSITFLRVFTQQCRICVILILVFYPFCFRITKPQTFADCIGNELPLGWEESYDSQIGVYYINHVNRKSIYFHSQHISPLCPQKSLCHYT